MIGIDFDENPNWISWQYVMRQNMKCVAANSIFLSYLTHFVSRKSVVGIATGYGLDDRGGGVRVPGGLGFFSFPSRPDRLWGSPSLLSNGYGGLFTRW
jgi:hypothetical protein